MQPNHPLSRRSVLQALSAIGVGSLAFQRTLAAQVAEKGSLTAEMIKQAEWVADLELSDEEREAIAKSFGDTLASAARIRKFAIDADTPPAQVFRPDFFYEIADVQEAEGKPAAKSEPKPPTSLVQVSWSIDGNAKPLGADELAFTSIGHQASLLATKQLSSRELTEMYLARLKRYDPVLKCVVTLLEEHAIELAKASDQRRAEGRSVGALDGIPWVAKDLIAMPPWKTTWGLNPLKIKYAQPPQPSQRGWPPRELLCSPRSP